MPESGKVAAVACDLTARAIPGTSAVMRISIVLTTHNRPALLAGAIGSVLAQTSDAWEFVIVNDGSTPPATLQENALGGNVARVRFVRHQTQHGAAFPWSSFAFSCRSGIGWRHLSLLGRLPKRTIFKRPRRNDIAIKR